MDVGWAVGEVLRRNARGDSSDSGPDARHSARRRHDVRPVVRGERAGPASVPPEPRFMRYLAESGTGAASRTRIAIANPGTRPATVVLTFLRTDGAAIRKTLRIDPHSRATVHPELVAGLDAAEFSTTVESDEEVLVDRSTSKNGTDYVSHGETSVPAPSRSWFIADGATQAGLNLFYVIHNPGSTEATVFVRYLLAPPRAPLSKTYAVAAGSRYTVWVNAEAETDPALAALASTDVSAVVTSTAPIIVERQIYLDRDGQSFAVGHGSPGIPAAASRWFFAEGATGPTFDFSLTLVNPSPAAAAVKALYRLDSGELVTRDHLVPPNGRAVIVVNGEDTRLANAAVSVSLESTNGVDFAAERTLHWRAQSTASGLEAHHGAGASKTATAWGLAEGEVGGGADTDTLLDQQPRGRCRRGPRDPALRGRIHSGEGRRPARGEPIDIERCRRVPHGCREAVRSSRPESRGQASRDYSRVVHLFACQRDAVPSSDGRDGDAAAGGGICRAG